MCDESKAYKWEETAKWDAVKDAAGKVTAANNDDDVKKIETGFANMIKVSVKVVCSCVKKAWNPKDLDLIAVTGAAESLCGLTKALLSRKPEVEMVKMVLDTLKAIGAEESLGQTEEERCAAEGFGPAMITLEQTTKALREKHDEKNLIFPLPKEKSDLRKVAKTILGNADGVLAARATTLVSATHKSVKEKNDELTKIAKGRPDGGACHDGMFSHWGWD